MWKHLCSVWVRYFLVQELFLDIFHLFPWCILIIIALIGGVTDVETTACTGYLTWHLCCAVVVTVLSVAGSLLPGYWS